MDILSILCVSCIGGFAILGFARGFVKMAVPILSAVLSLLLILLLKKWLLSFLFRWAVLGGAHILTRFAVIVLLFVLGTLAFKWVIGILKILTRLPLIGGVNKLLGLLTGAIEGALTVWLVFYIAKLLGGRLGGIEISAALPGSAAEFFYQNNLIAHLMNTFFSEFIS